ncbi:PREDICTED: leucine-rich PPR motif-containing protein, mitochondrial [Nanorana parkeri]|uniref:leucine-rich PPR motif-containing protein, mitochondrial n=1 Tax=Nanorana parkeri TaxID=125878 RepID=UPI00085482B5|nr:PREDICTED: leucine-rich PPR motif-containing protein, mitochondrial [Nanorana parkeri]
MAAMLAGARLVLRQGLRFLPAYRVRPAAVPVRCLSSSARFLTTAVLDKSTVDVEHFESNHRTQSQSDSWSLYQMGKRLKKNGRISKKHFLDSFEEVCKAGKPSSSQAWLLLQACGSLMPGVPPAERTEIADSVWNKMKELGVVFNETHYNMLLRKYIENEHTFSPTEFLAGMEAAKVQPNQSTYEALIAAYCKDGDIEGASKILGFMKSTKLPITEDVFSSLITGHARAGDMENAKNILSVMEGSGLMPGKSAYVALLHAYAEKGDVEGIKQTLEDCKLNLSETVYLKLIYSLARAGHSQLVPDIFERMQACKGYLQDVMNLCLMLLTQGYGDTAVLVAKRFVPLHELDSDLSHQRGNFFLRHCVHLNMPANIIKKYASELQESDLHNTPLQFALLCALEYDKKDMALELMRTMKEERLPLRPHYCWPLLASFNNENDIQGVLQVLKAMHEMGVKLDFNTFRLYVAKLFGNVESPESLLESAHTVPAYSNAVFRKPRSSGNGSIDSGTSDTNDMGNCSDGPTDGGRCLLGSPSLPWVLVAYFFAGDMDCGDKLDAVPCEGCGLSSGTSPTPPFAQPVLLRPYPSLPWCLRGLWGGSTGAMLSLEAFSSTMDSFVSRMEHALTQRPPRKRALPAPLSVLSGDSEEEGGISAAAAQHDQGDSSQAESGSEDESGTALMVQERELVTALVGAVRETLKIEETPSSSALPSWKRPSKSFTVPKRFLSKWSTPPAVDPPVSRLNKATVIPVEDSPSFRDPSDRKAEAVAHSVGYFLRCLIGSMSDSEVQAKEECLKQYFHQLEEMGVNDLTDTAGSVYKMEEQIETNIKHIQSSKLKFKDLLDKLVAAQDVEKALELTSKDGSHFNFGMYMTVLQLCCDQNRPKEALQLKEEIGQRGFTQHPSVSKYLSLVKVLALNGFVEDAINVLTEMHERHVAVSKFFDKSFFHILNQLAIKDDVDAVNRLHEHIVTLNLAKPTANLCTPLVKVHLNRNELLPALEAMLECQKKYNCCPMEYEMLLKLIETGETTLLKKAVDGISDALGERQMLLTLLFAFIETGKYAEAQKIVETPGLRSIPKKVTWVLERFKKMNKVESLEKCVEITRVLFDCNREDMYFQLLSLYGKNNDWTKAVPLWHKMKEEEIPMKERTLRVFKNIFRENDQNISTHIPEFREKSGKAKQPDLDEMSRRVEDFCQNKMITEAYNVFLEAEQNNQRLCKSSYSRLSKGLLYADLFEDAWKVDEVAKSHFNDSTMDNLFFNRFLAYQVRRDCLKDALRTLERMLKHGSVPNQTVLDKLREALALNGDMDSLEKMEEITSDLKETFPRMERAFYNAKLLFHFKNGNFEEAISMIESLCSKEPNTSIYYLSLTLVKNNMTEALEKLSIVAEMFANQFSIYRPVTDLFIVFAKSGKVEEAKRLLEKNQISQLLDVLGDPLYKHIGYNSLMKQYISTNKLSDAVDLYDRMKAEQIEPVEDHLKQLAVLLREADKPVPFPEPQVSAFQLYTPLKIVCQCSSSS